MSNSRLKSTVLFSTIEFEHLTFEHRCDEHFVTFVVTKGYKILRGYGKSIIKAINDLHSVFI